MEDDTLEVAGRALELVARFASDTRWRDLSGAELQAVIELKRRDLGERFVQFLRNGADPEFGIFKVQPSTLHFPPIHESFDWKAYLDAEFFEGHVFRNVTSEELNTISRQTVLCSYLDFKHDVQVMRACNAIQHKGSMTRAEAAYVVARMIREGMYTTGVEQEYYVGMGAGEIHEISWSPTSKKWVDYGPAYEEDHFGKDARFLLSCTRINP